MKCGNPKCTKRTVANEPYCYKCYMMRASNLNKPSKSAYSPRGRRYAPKLTIDTEELCGNALDAVSYIKGTSK